MKQWLKSSLLLIMFVLLISHSVYAKDGKCISGNCFKGQGTFYYLNTDKYTGEWKDGRKNGPGTMVYANGDKYTGEWKDGRKNGQGTMVYANGDKYTGEWKDGRKNGQNFFTGEVKKTNVSCPQTIEYNKEFTLTKGVACLLPNKSKLEIEKLVEDSRCPANARCIWAGRVVFKFSLKKGNKLEYFNLEDGDGSPHSDSIKIDSYNLTITKVLSKNSVNLILKK